MKKFILFLSLFPSIAFSSPFDLLLNQRNIADTATLVRTVPIPSPGVRGLLATDPVTNFPRYYAMDSSFYIYGNNVGTGSDWSNVMNKPAFSLVSTTGDYNDLINKPAPGGQVNSDWSSTSGPSEILNKPSLFSGSYADLSGRPSLSLVATTGAYSDLSGLPSLFSGAYSSLTGIPSTFTPSAHTQAWSTITATPTTLSGYGVTDGVTTSTLASYATTASVTAGLAAKFNTPSGTAAQYVRGDGALATLPVTPAISINDSPGRALVTSTASAGFQVSATRTASVCYEGSFSTTSTIGGPSSASVFLETADTNSTTAGDWTIKAQQTYTNTITLAVVLNQVQGNNWSFCRYVPAGKYVRIRMGSVTGTASATINATQQEVLN